MISKIKDAIREPLSLIGVEVVDVIYHESDFNLEIVVDSDDMDLDKVVEATHIINPILDEGDFIQESYTLDVISKERGDESDGQ